jgi:glycosyl hydrolase family 127 (putative beta-L-arabinofuranosidase)
MKKPCPFSSPRKTPQTCALKLRHPYWCEEPEVKLNGERISIESSPSSYMTIERTWKTGDMLELRLPMTLRLDLCRTPKGSLCSNPWADGAGRHRARRAGVPNPAKTAFQRTP